MLNLKMSHKAFANSRLACSFTVGYGIDFARIPHQSMFGMLLYCCYGIDSCCIDKNFLPETT